MRNCMYGYRVFATDICVAIERESAGEVTRQELRSDWQKHWPELAAEKVA